MANLAFNSNVQSSHNPDIYVLDVVGNPVEQFTLKAGEAIAAGAGVKMNGTTAKAEQGLATTAANANILGIAIKNAKTGQGVTVIKRGILGGFNLSGLAFGASVYLSDTAGALADAAGTVSKIVGRVVPVHGQLPGSNPMKALYVEL